MQEQDDFKTSAMSEELDKIPSNKYVTPNLILKMWPDSILTRMCEPVTEFNDELGQTIIALMKLMIAADGVGLAASQAGILKRIIVYKVDNQEGYLINPLIISQSSEKQTLQEGCLSFPGIFIGVERHLQVKVTYQEISGEQKELEASGPLAQMIQHEIDHLNGTVFTRYLSKLKRDIVNKKMSKLKKILDKRKELHERMENAKGRDTRNYDFSIRGESV